MWRGRFGVEIKWCEVEIQVEPGLLSHSTQLSSFPHFRGRQIFTGLMTQPTVSEALKEGG